MTTKIPSQEPATWVPEIRIMVQGQPGAIILKTSSQPIAGFSVHACHSFQATREVEIRRVGVQVNLDKVCKTPSYWKKKI
jgi:hypothetical protein